jgi:hypothetical protein
MGAGKLSWGLEGIDLKHTEKANFYHLWERTDADTRKWFMVL